MKLTHFWVAAFVALALPAVVPPGVRAEAAGIAASKSDTGPLDSAAWERVLKTQVNDDGQVNYEALKKSRADLDAFVKSLATHGPSSQPELYKTLNDKVAFWSNAYNALVMQGVVDKYPIKSVKDIKIFYGFFKRMDFRADNRTLVLEDIETGLLRPLGEPRIHFAINCASKSCPKLFREPWQADTLNEMLDTAARRYLNDARENRLDPKEGTLYLSSIFKWYEADFLGWLKRNNRPGGIGDYAAQYFNDKNLETWKSRKEWTVKYLDYDWNLNRQ